MTTAEQATAPQGDAYLNFLEEYPKTGPGTTSGKMLRHYWHPVCLGEDLRDLPFPVRMLGEDLVAFRQPDGAIGLVGARCPHRCASLEYGQVQPDGLQCSYHGWTFNNRGHCMRTPLEPSGSTLKDEVRQLWYPAQEWAGVVWCYMGEDKDSPPPLPKIDILTRTDGELLVERGDYRNYNWLNFVENFADMMHGLVLHAFVPGQVPEALVDYTDLSVRTTVDHVVHQNFETSFGMKSVMVHDTAEPDRKFVNTWSIALPGYCRFGGIAAGLAPDFTDDRRESGVMIRIIDDHSYEIFRYTLIRPGNFRVTFTARADDTKRGLAEGVRGTVEIKPYDIRKYAGWEGRPPVEDLVIQESQGVIPPRHLEYLGKSDSGVVLLRRIFRRAMDNVARGKPPKTPVLDDDGVIRTDTFKGFAHVDDIVLGPNNMPDSRDGRGLIRDEQGATVFA